MPLFSPARGFLNPAWNGGFPPSFYQSHPKTSLEGEGFSVGCHGCGRFSLPKFRFDLPLKGGEWVSGVRSFLICFVKICLPKNDVYV